MRRRAAAAVPDPQHRFSERLRKPGLFLRFGRIGAGPSRVRLDDEFRNEVLGGKRFERGLSAFFATRRGADYVIEPPDHRRASYHLDAGYFNDMVRLFLPSIADDHVYVFRGKLIAERHLPEYDERRDVEVVWHGYATGSDGEPLVDPASVRGVRRLSARTVLQRVFYGGGPVPLGDRIVGRVPVRHLVWDYDHDDEDDELEDAPRAAVSRRRPTRRT